MSLCLLLSPSPSSFLTGLTLEINGFVPLGIEDEMRMDYALPSKSLNLTEQSLLQRIIRVAAMNTRMQLSDILIVCHTPPASSPPQPKPVQTQKDVIAFLKIAQASSYLADSTGQPAMFGYRSSLPDRIRIVEMKDLRATLGDSKETEGMRLASFRVSITNTITYHSQYDSKHSKRSASSLDVKVVCEASNFACRFGQTAYRSLDGLRMACKYFLPTDRPPFTQSLVSLISWWLQMSEDLNSLASENSTESDHYPIDPDDMEITVNLFGHLDRFQAHFSDTANTPLLTMFLYNNYFESCISPNLHPSPTPPPPPPVQPQTGLPTTERKTSQNAHQQDPPPAPPLPSTQLECEWTMQCNSLLIVDASNQVIAFSKTETITDLTRLTHNVSSVSSSDLSPFMRVISIKSDNLLAFEDTTVCISTQLASLLESTWPTPLASLFDVLYSFWEIEALNSTQTVLKRVNCDSLNLVLFEPKSQNPTEVEDPSLPRYFTDSEVSFALQVSLSKITLTYPTGPVMSSVENMCRMRFGDVHVSFLPGAAVQEDKHSDSETVETKSPEPQRAEFLSLLNLGCELRYVGRLLIVVMCCITLCM